MKYQSQLDFPDSPFSKAARQPLMLGVMPSIKGKSSRPHMEWDFDYCLKVVQTAEALGFDVAMSSAQWAPHPYFEAGNSMDAFIAPLAMAAATSRILLVSTLHMLYGNWHPLHLAKFAATMDHISKGRWGLNAVTGYAEGEFAMFGQARPEHDLRFKMTSELIDTMHDLWASGPGYSRKSEYGRWAIEEAWVSPKPLYGRPIMVSAGGSDAAVDYFAQHSDALFTATPGSIHFDANMKSLPGITKRIKAKHPRGKVWISPAIASRATMEETEAYILEQNSKIDRTTLPPEMRKHYASDSQSWIDRARDMTVYPHPKHIGGSCEIFGPPELVAEQIIALHGTGVDGLMLKFIDYQRDLEHFGEHILPLLLKAGVRLPPPQEQRTDRD